MALQKKLLPLIWVFEQKNRRTKAAFWGTRCTLRLTLGPVEDTEGRQGDVDVADEQNGDSKAALVIGLAGPAAAQV